MILKECKYPSDQRNALESPDAAPAEKGLGNLFRLPGGIVKYVIKTPHVWIPLAALVLATMIFWITDVDYLLSQPFFVDQSYSTKSDSHWPLRIAEPWKSLYNLGVYPAWIIGAGGLLVFLSSFLWAKLKPYRDAGLFFALLLALGPGLLINGILKPFWGRPRPHDTIPFSGTDKYVRVGAIGNGSEGASFPSGHASMGFYLMAPGFVLYRKRRRLAKMFFALGLAGGTIMGLARIVAGSHFASDVVWSAGIVYFTGLALAALFRFGEEETPDIENKTPGVFTRG
ncbi:MAG: phosphatase PAP2 family protein [Thermoguttaceae bacterium]|jgi:membrane-associated PAP2 superfamily phosphatase